ncbi:hypothetical protein [Halorubrum sp. F4]|uniref:hypothetical protein n=1 Tax=Halorubrum sp. F4 TaxID=2989715 RepID=UPI0024814E1A|nr:hypothetical protein [Halorubrum sp. F4]
MNSRKNAMLTTEDRRWLTGSKAYEGEHAKQQRYQRRRDIRDRIYNSLLDFSIVFEHLEEAEREKLFREDEGGISADPELDQGVRDGLAFLLYSTGITASMDREGGVETDARRLLRDAVREAGRVDDYVVEDVSLDVQARPATRSQLQRKLVDGEELSMSELAILLESESIDTDEIQAHMRTMITEQGDDAGSSSSEIEATHTEKQE